MAARLTVRLQPRASQSEIKPQPDGSLLVRVTAAPVENAANQALLRLLAKSIGVPKSLLTIVRGAKSRLKVVEIAELTDDELTARLRSLGELHG